MKTPNKKNKIYPSSKWHFSFNFQLSTNNCSGFIALTSAIIISIILMAITLSLSLYSFFSKTNISGTEYKKISTGLAEACVETALLNLASNKAYAGNETVSIGTGTCSILPIETLGSQKIIKTSASTNSSTVNLKVTTNIEPISIVSWEELAGF